MVIPTRTVPKGRQQEKAGLKAKEEDQLVTPEEETLPVAPVVTPTRAPEVVQMANRHGAEVQSISQRLNRSQRHHELSFQLPDATSGSFRTLPVMMKCFVEVAQLP